MAELLVQVFAAHFPPSNASGAARPGRWARYLPQHGVHCRVTAQRIAGASDAGLVTFVSPEQVRGGWRAARALAGLLHRLAPYNEQWEWASAALSHACRANRAAPAQAVLSTFPPLGTHMAGLLFHLRYGVPWIADFRDPLAGNPYRNRKWAGPYDRFLERLICRRAAAVLVTNDAVAAQWRARYPASAQKIHVLWNGFDPAEAATVPRPAELPRLLVHAGWLYGPRRPTSLLRAVALLLDSGRIERGRWRVELIGGFEADTFCECEKEKERLMQADALGLRGGFRPKKELDEAVARASILVLLDLTGEERSVQVPAKLFDYVRTGLPVVAWSPPGSPTRLVLERSGIPCLAFAPDEPVERVAERLAEWLENPPPPSAPSEWFLENFDGARQAEWLARLIRAVAAGESRGSKAGMDAAASD